MVEKCVWVASVETHGVGDLQRCLIPAPLLVSIQGTAGGYIQISLTDDTYLICRAMPVVDAYCEKGFQVIACNCVFGSKIDSDTTLKTGNYTIKTSQVIPLTAVNMKAVTVNVVFNTVEDVQKYRKSKKYFDASIQKMLSFYAVVNESRIKFRNNSLAKLLGISVIMIEKCVVSPQEVGIITSDTTVIINGIESEDRRKMKVLKTVNLGGLDQVLAYLRRLVTEPWVRQKEFNKAGVLYPSGVLLVGPPGCGKTSLVRQLCAETGACLVGTAGAELVSPYEGESEKNFVKVAKRAQVLSEEGPCLFFIDEIDSLCPLRTMESNLSDLRLAGQVLLALDECRQYRNLILMAATNRPYDLDPALRRSGRFEVEILLNVPSAADRRSILSVHSTNLLPSNHSGLAKIVQVTPGFVGADLQSLTETVQMEVDAKCAEKTLSPEEIIDIMEISAASITPSIHKTLDFITAKPLGAPVGGLKEVKLQLDQIFTHHIKFAAAYDRLKLKRPRGLLLFGPRGCGKTRLVASLASSKGCTFLSANASHLLSPYVGDSEKRIAALFHAARLAQPTIIFIDEIDGIFGSRERGGSTVQINILNELLQAMDGADVRASSLQGASLLTSSLTASQDGVLICAATNHPETLDPALLRPGRFDHLLYVPMPDFDARHSILRLKTSKMHLESDSILEELARLTKGFTGAELENLIMKATMAAVKKNHYDQDSYLVCLQEEDLWEVLKCSSPSVTEEEVMAFQDFERAHNIQK